MSNTTFASRVLSWFDEHGRKDLPWQQNVTPYRVWVSEIMLQQTQVVTAIPYYNKFMQRFPDVLTLAAAEQDEVLAHWAGLGYYARARNLHAAAQQIVELHNGTFPADIDAAIALPGIGRSTAGAILTLALQQSHPILDGNVKRVLARHQMVEGWTGKTSVQNQLWQMATERTPTEQAGAYTQAMMDLGATLCTRSKPSCHRCPISSDCLALTHEQQKNFPNPKPKKIVPEKHAMMYLLLNERGELLLRKREPTGIWGGLWSLPQSEVYDQPLVLETLDLGVGQVLDTWHLRHTFSHFHLNITAQLIQVRDTENNSAGHLVMDNNEQVWYNVATDVGRYGLPKPVQTLIDTLAQYRATKEH